MSNSNLIRSIILGATCLAFCLPARAATLQTFGPGSAVAAADASATFDSLTANHVVHLDTYVEGVLRVTTSGDSWAADLNLSAQLDPFHLASAPDRAFHATAWGNEDWVTIQTTNRAHLYGVEFMYGNCWTTGDIYGQYPWGNDLGFVEWQTWKNDVLVSFGQIGPNPVLPLATVLGFYDPAGFDQLLVRCRIDNSSPPNLQVIALDNLSVMLANRPPAPVIWGRDFGVNLATGTPSLTVYDTIAGCQYRMVYQDDLASPTWHAVTPPLPDGWQSGGGTLTFTHLGAARQPHRFYRVEAR